MNKSFSHYIIALFFLSACAQQRGLSGGEKDTIPPTIVATYPAVNSVQFTGRQFAIEFDEYVQLNAISQELVVSPPLQKQPKVRIKHKTVIVKWDEELLPNTTYVFNFGNGVSDVNEKNSSEDLTYVFSTGDAIDSLQISGKVWNASLDEPCKTIKVLAFRDDTTLLAKKPQPAYFARTKEDGTYTLSYMRENTYYLYALDDINGNYRYDMGEAIGFLGGPHQLTIEKTDTIGFYLSTPRFETPVVNDYDTDSIGSLSFSWDPYYSQPIIESANTIPFVTSRNTTQDTVLMYFKGRPTDRFETVYVSWNDVFRDTISIPFFEKALNTPFTLGHGIDKRMRVDQKLALNTKGDIQVRDASRVTLLEDSIAIAASIAPAEKGFEIIAQRKPGKKYQLTILPEAFSNPVGQTNDTVVVNFTSLKPEELGELILDVKFDSVMNNNLFQLYDKAGLEVFRAINIQPGELTIPHLSPGEYTASFLHDTNSNGLFDPAIYKTKQQPERVYRLNAKMNVRSNWQLRQRWEIRD
ncbi:MAG: Ig-like domain-containing protein [Flavobacteriales bacterium]